MLYHLEKVAAAVVQAGNASCDRADQSTVLVVEEGASDHSS